MPHVTQLVVHLLPAVTQRLQSILEGDELRFDGFGLGVELPDELRRRHFHDLLGDPVVLLLKGLNLGLDPLAGKLKKVVVGVHDEEVVLGVAVHGVIERVVHQKRPEAERQRRIIVEGVLDSLPHFVQQEVVLAQLPVALVGQGVPRLAVPATVQ